jgi:hypothetical protein
MFYETLRMLHIGGATVALLSGFLATALRKGSGAHGAAGSVFFVSMLVMSSSAAYLSGILNPNSLNLVVSLLTFYLVTTAWRAAKQREARISWFDRCALAWVLLVSVTAIVYGIEAAGSPTKTKQGMPAAAYLAFGTVALLCAVTDSRMILRGGVAGAQRIARHLWRMCLALLIATLSFYPGQARNLPASIRETSLSYVPHILLVGTMLFWRVRVARRKKTRSVEESGSNSGDPNLAAVGGAR